MDKFTERGKDSYQDCITELLQKRVLVPTQQYFNGPYMEETVHDLTTKLRQRIKSMTFTNKEEVEGTFNLIKPRIYIMHTFFYSNIYEFGGSLEGMLDEETTEQQYKKCTSLVKRHNTSSMLMFQC